MLTAAIYFSIILSMLFSGTILKAVSVETSTSPTIGAMLFLGLATLYNIATLIPIQKIMRDQPLRIEIQEGHKEPASAKSAV